MINRQQVSRSLKRAWAVASLLCPVFITSFIISFVFSAPAHAQKHVYTYDVYAGGFHVVEAHLTMDFTEKDRYSLVMDAHTRGFLGSVAPWQGVFETHGWVLGDGRYQPEQHKSTTTWRKEDEIKDYAYGKDGRFLSLTKTEHDKEPDKTIPDDELTQGTIDALTGTLVMLQNMIATGECHGSSEVFDGKRRFEQRFVHEEAVELKASRYNIYEGPAAKCIVEVIPGAGKWHEKPRGWMSIQEQGRERGLMPTVWVADVTRDGTPAAPVKIRVKTDYGTLFMHLSAYSDGDDTTVSKKRADR